MTRSRNPGGYTRFRRLSGAVLFSLRPSTWPWATFSFALQRNRVRFDTLNASVAASTPCFSQNAMTVNRFFARSVVIWCHRTVSLYKRCAPRTPLHTLNCLTSQVLPECQMYLNLCRTPPRGARRGRVSAEGRYEECHVGTSTCRRTRCPHIRHIYGAGPRALFRNMKC